MSVFRAAVVQLRSGLVPAENVAAAEGLIRQAAAEGAQYVLTPEMTTVVDLKRQRLLAAISTQDVDPSLARFRQLASELGIVVHIGSMAIRLPGDQVANRAFVIGPDGAMVATYDKIHMFDADLGGAESYRESRVYKPGKKAVVANLPAARIGLSICYDLRFPQLYRLLAKAGASVLAVPAVFTHTTGQAHWHVLVRARAIENGAFVVAAAQGGLHEDERTSFGHSMIVDPWGEVMAELGSEPGYILADIDTDASVSARSRIPALTHDREFGGFPSSTSAELDKVV